MMSNTKMEIDRLNSCVQRYKFLSPRFSSNYYQRTECDLSSSSHVVAPDNQNAHQTASSSRNKLSSSFFSLFSSWKASCESNVPVATATDRMERAKESLKRMDASKSSGIISEVDIQNYLSKETGKDRLIKMFSRDHIGQTSPEFKFMYQVTLQSAAVTFLIMTTLAGRQAKQEFIDRNRATVFNTRFQAFRRLQDAVFLYSMKEGAKWAIRVSLFTISFLGISQSIAVYRNKSSVWEYTIAAGTTIGVLKANMGLRGFVVGTSFGAVMGTMMGFVALGAMKAFNETQEQRHYWQIQKELEKEKMMELKGKLPEGSAVEMA